jgi:hypothetical protein
VGWGVWEYYIYVYIYGYKGVGCVRGVPAGSLEGLRRGGLRLGQVGPHLLQLGLVCAYVRAKKKNIYVFICILILCKVIYIYIYIHIHIYIYIFHARSTTLM